MKEALIFALCLFLGSKLLWNIISWGDKKIAQERKKYYKQYPIGSYIEVNTYNRERQMYNLQIAVNANALDYIEPKTKTVKISEYYQVVSIKEYCIAMGIKRTLWNYYLNDHNVLLCVKEIFSQSPEYKTVTKDIISNVWAKKELCSMSEVKLKIIELKERKNKNEIVESYSNSREKSNREDF